MEKKAESRHGFAARATTGLLSQLDQNHSARSDSLGSPSTRFAAVPYRLASRLTRPISMSAGKTAQLYGPVQSCLICCRIRCAFVALSLRFRRAFVALSSRFRCAIRHTVSVFAQRIS
jgi:hypothetical protein